MNVYFYCMPQGDVDKAAYQHCAISLAEGLKELGISVFSNQDYWAIDSDGESQDYLFCNNPDVEPRDCSVVILNDEWLSYGREVPALFFEKKRKFLSVYLDSADRARSKSWDPSFRCFDLILRTHYNDYSYYPKNVRPWAFGLSSRIIKSLDQPVPYEDRKSSVLVNYRSIHPIRRLAQLRVLPAIQKYLAVDDAIDVKPDVNDGQDYAEWLRTGKRHYPAYYKRLCESKACFCFGGYLAPPWPQDQTAWNRWYHKIATRLRLRPKRFAVQWDSWRFWESLVAGSVVFHVDFEHYGIRLPVMPNNGEHYIGVDFGNVSKVLPSILDNQKALAEISQAGRLWAIQHYSPRATAERFLNVGKEINPNI